MFKPNFTITNELLNHVAEIESLRTMVGHARLLPERAIELHYRATVEKVYSSTSIEGNPLTRKQVASVLSGQSVARRKYAEIEVRNYKKALDFIEKRKSAGGALETGDILHLHELAMKGLLPDEKVGKLRSGAIYIVDQDENLKYTGPGAKAVQRKLEELAEWLRAEGKKIHPCVATAILHYQFVSIHPFADGNGRVARLLAMLYLGLRDYDFSGSIALDTYYAQERGEYYKALHDCQGEKYQEGQDITSWVAYFTAGFLSSAKVLMAEVAILSVIEPALEQKRLDRDETDLLSYALQFGSVALSEGIDILPHLSRRTLQRKLKNLADAGFLLQKGTARNTRYHWIT